MYMFALAVVALNRQLKRNQALVELAVFENCWTEEPLTAGGVRLIAGEVVPLPDEPSHGR